jgi:hypothetical protein
MSQKIGAKGFHPPGKKPKPRSSFSRFIFKEPDESWLQRKARKEGRT